MLRKLLLFSVLCFIVVANRERLFTHIDTLYIECERVLAKCETKSLQCKNTECISSYCLDPSHR